MEDGFPAPVFLESYPHGQMFLYYLPVWIISLFFIFPCITSSGIMSLSGHGIYITV